MKNNLLILSVLLCLILGSNNASGQRNSYRHDSTPIERLDYELTRQQFHDYYGTDDTAKAVINMFYRKRGEAGITYCLVPGVSCVAGYITILLGAEEAIISLLTSGFAKLSPSSIAIIYAGEAILLLGIIVEPVIFTINRIIYSRQKLLYDLVRRERGQKLPTEILEQLKPSDFN